VHYDDAEAQIGARLLSGRAAAGRVFDVYNKVDLVAAAPIGSGLALSATTGQGLEELRRRLLEAAGWHAQSEGVFIARSRHLDALRRTREHLQQADAHAAQRDAALELLAEELRLAHDALGEITGAFTSDDLLGVIFSRFCIGK
jgi:tRNA modification GTPase